MEVRMIPLTPLSFLRRSSDVYPDKIAVVDTPRRAVTYSNLKSRADSMANALRGAGVQAGDRVAVLGPNGLPLLEAHFGVPGSGAALVALNTRLSGVEYSYIINHCGARILIVDSSLAPAISEIRDELPANTLIIQVGEASPEGWPDYEGWLDQAPVGPGMVDPSDENDVIAINYTSGTTGRPKGVVYTHRGAYLNALGTALGFGVQSESVYLWTLPMFHCNGWCYTWAVTAVGARHVCTPRPDPEAVLDLLASEGVTHFCAAPIVLNSVINHPRADSLALTQRVSVATGGAPPSPTTIARTEALGIQLVHLYGMTETYGPSLICEPQVSWEDLSEPERAEKMARQGVRTLTVDQVRVVGNDAIDVARDGQEMGEIVFRSNTAMAGYYRDEDATRAAFLGYIEIRDRAKDIIISGGENISSIEVEHALLSHPAVLEAAVIAIDDDKWGEVPMAFVVLRDGMSTDENDLIEHVKGRLARFKAPHRVVFHELPKTSTGKIQKAQLRDWARSHEAGA
jgi:fatty-acyl-CoA synthase